MFFFAWAGTYFRKRFCFAALLHRGRAHSALLFIPSAFSPQLRFQLFLGNHIGGQDAAPEKRSDKQSRRGRECCRIQHGVAAGFRAVAQQCADLRRPVSNG